MTYPDDYVRYWITREGCDALDAIERDCPATYYDVPSKHVDESEESFQRALLAARAEPCAPGECHCEDGWLP